MCVCVCVCVCVCACVCVCVCACVCACCVCVCCVCVLCTTGHFIQGISAPGHSCYLMTDGFKVQGARCVFMSVCTYEQP